MLQFVDELGKLQDRVPAFSADKAEAIIERDLGQPVSKVTADSVLCTAARQGSWCIRVHVCGVCLCVKLQIC